MTMEEKEREETKIEKIHRYLQRDRMSEKERERERDMNTIR